MILFEVVKCFETVFFFLTTAAVGRYVYDYGVYVLCINFVPLFAPYSTLYLYLCWWCWRLLQEYSALYSEMTW